LKLEQWGELRSIIHERSGLNALVSVLLDWPIPPEEDDALQHYLASHRESWVWQREQLPPTNLLEQWIRGRFLFLLGSAEVFAAWNELQPQRLLNIQSVWVDKEQEFFTFCWFISALEELVHPLDWLTVGARLAIEDNSGKLASGESGVAFLKAEVRSGLYELDNPNDQPWLDISVYDWALRPGELTFPRLDVELSTESFTIWVEALGCPSTSHWISLLELGWQIDQMMAGSRYTYLDDEKEELFHNALTFYKSMRTACSIACGSTTR
jgi:hypothetical protein